MALNYLSFLQQKQEEDLATQDILQNKTLVRQIRQSRNDWQNGKKEKFSFWRSIKRYV